MVSDTIEMIKLRFISVKGDYNGLLNTFLLHKCTHFIGWLKHPYTTQANAKAFVKEVIKLHGILDSIITHRNRIFLSKFWKENIKLYGTQLKHITPSFVPCYAAKGIERNMLSRDISMMRMRRVYMSFVQTKE